jgi:hypothetical protein
MGCGLRNAVKRVPYSNLSAHAFLGAGNCPYGGGNFTALTGSITIPKYYAWNVRCDYIITTGKTIYLSFDSFSTEERSDFVEVYDGTSVKGRRIGKFSGTIIPGVITAKSGSVFVRFTSDDDESGAGVSMRWSDIAPATLAPTTPSPTTASPTFTGGTPSHAKPDEDARMLWRALVQTGVLVCAGFALGALRSRNCPASYFRIIVEDLCRSAAATAGQLYQGRETRVGPPRGCNLQEGGVFLNDATDAPSQWVIVPDYYPLCSGARPPVYSRRGP